MDFPTDDPVLIKDAIDYAYEHVFVGRQGEMVLKDLEESFCVHRTTMPQDGNPLTLAYNEGMRSVVLYIKNRISERAGETT